MNRLLEDPQWHPKIPGVHFVPRPGHMLEINLPVVMTSELEGMVYFNDQGKKRGIDDLTLHPATASDQPAAVSFKLTRRGPYSSYGNIALVFVSPNGATQPLVQMDGIALYTPNTQRLMRLELPHLPTGKGHLRVTYTLDAKALAPQAEVALP